MFLNDTTNFYYICQADKVKIQTTANSFAFHLLSLKKLSWIYIYLPAREEKLEIIKVLADSGSIE